MKTLILIVMVLTISNSASALTQNHPYCSPKTQTYAMRSCLKYKTAYRLRKCAIRAIKLGGCYKITLVGRNG